MSVLSLIQNNKNRLILALIILAIMLGIVVPAFKKAAKKAEFDKQSIRCFSEIQKIFRNSSAKEAIAIQWLITGELLRLQSQPDQDTRPANCIILDLLNNKILANKEASHGTKNESK